MPESATRASIFAVLRDTKWLAAISLFLSGILYLPSQIQELYRAILADRDPLDIALLYLPLVFLCLFIWFGANQVAVASATRVKTTGLSIWFARFWPALLGSAPLFSAAIAQLNAIPRGFAHAEETLQYLMNTPGNVWDKLNAQLTQSVGTGLSWGGFVTLGVAVLLFVGVGLLSIATYDFSKRTNEKYFENWWFFALTVFLIVALTITFFVFPVRLPQFIGVFGIIALFTFCVVAFLVHFSLLTINFTFPFIPLILVGAALFSIADLNDNHEIRLIEGSTPAPEPISVEQAFQNWFAIRPDQHAYSDEYPVYIVAAQGGGIYAAYQTAVFLARMQDTCPAFRDHLFAISSVSGGSVGAAVFASGLRLTEQSGSASRPAGPCPDITQFLNKNMPPYIEKPKANETYVRKVLSSDLLSPLIAATLFPDFLQGFLPFRLPFFFDRAAALEYTLEAAADRVSENNLLKQSYSSSWNADGNFPALLLNATDVGSGRRVLFAPFVVASGTSAPTDSLINFAALKRQRGEPASNNSRFDLRLSTAAFISARFPWVTPAATVKTTEPSLFGSATKIRLVDGGYFDNSGVDTALDLVEALKPMISSLNAANGSTRAANTDQPKHNPRVVIKLIALSGGTYPVRDSFALGEILEPVRALLSTRQSRGYVAISRAARTMPEVSYPVTIHGDTETVTIKDLSIAKLSNKFYELPMGWSVSSRTRDIIEKQSGRYWDCEFTTKFTQSAEENSETDCVQMLIYHQLNQSLTRSAAILDVATANHYRLAPRPNSLPPPTSVRFSEFEKNNIIRCYVDGDTWTWSQSNVIKALLEEWNYYPQRNDDRMLAYILGTTAHETLRFRVFTENLSFPSAERIYQLFRRRFNSAAAAEPYTNEPEALANLVYGNRPDIGNIIEGDGWRYRGRGIFPIWGRSNYQLFSTLTQTPLEDEPDVIVNRYIGARVAFAFFFLQKMDRLDPYFNNNTEDWLGARKALPGLPRSNTGLPEGAEDVASISKQFFDCIKKAKQ
jgi:predicted chitinase